MILRHRAHQRDRGPGFLILFFVFSITFSLVPRLSRTLCRATFAGY